MMRKIILVFLLGTTFIACKSDKAPDLVKTNSEKVKEQKKELSIEMRFETNKPDEFTFVLNNIKKDEFQRKSISIIEKVSPTSNIDVISANFGENNISNTFTILLGNKEEKIVNINLISFSYGTKDLTISSSEIHKYFNLNKFVEIDSVNGTIITKRIDKKHNPAMFLKGKALEILLSK